MVSGNGNDVAVKRSILNNDVDTNDDCDYNNHDDNENNKWL